MAKIVPLLKRPLDIVFLVFFSVNILFITYIVDFEQIAVPGPVDREVATNHAGNNFNYPIWPPAPAIDLVHWWGANFDPVLLARPAWWMATIWIDALLFGPFYIAAIYAFIRGREWIRIPAFIFSSVLFTNVTIILSEEIWGVTASPAIGLVLAANAPWLLFPFLIVARMLPDHPFTEGVRETR